MGPLAQGPWGGGVLVSEVPLYYECAPGWCSGWFRDVVSRQWRVGPSAPTGFRGAQGLFGVKFDSVAAG